LRLPLAKQISPTGLSSAEDIADRVLRPATDESLKARIVVRWPEDSDEFRAFKLDIKENGIRQPLKITVDGQVIDGWTRCRAAQLWAMLEVPCVVIPPDEVKETILRELTLRRNLTKGQLVYTVEPFLEDVTTEKLQKRAKTGQFTVGALSAPTVESWVKAYGFSERLLRQATWLRKKFTAHPELRAEWEPKILDMENPIGLGAAKAGIEGKAATTGKARGPENQLELFSEGIVGRAPTLLMFWQASKKQAVEMLVKRAAKLKPEQCEGLAAMHSEIGKIYREQAKGQTV